MKLWETVAYQRTSLFGVYDFKLGVELTQILNDNKEVMGPYLKETYGIDLDERRNSVTPSIKEIEENLNRPMQGVKSTEEFYDKISSVHRIPLIKTPTFFLNSLDDPILGEKSIAYEAFENNENVILGVTKHGGHIGYHESVWTLSKTFFTKIAMQFLK